MVVTAESSSQERAEKKASHWSEATKALMVVAALLVFAHLPLLLEHFMNLWARPHYQFVVILPMAIWLLAKQRWDGAADSTGDEGSTGGIKALRPAGTLVWGPLLLLSLGTLATATYLRSPWLGMVSALVTCLGFILAIGGWPLLRLLFPAWVLAAMALPLPSNLDVRLITALREVTTHASSLVLDQFGILHLVSGNVIELPDQSLFVADACTGIHSLFVLLTCALLVGFWNRRGIVRILLLLVAAVAIVLVENVARVVGLAMELDYIGWDLTTGWRHTVFGFLLFAASLMFILSADQLLSFFWPSGWWISPRRWRWWRRSRHSKSDSEEDSHEEAAQPSVVWAEVMSLRTRRLLLPLAFAFAVLGLVQLVGMPTRAEQMVNLMKRHPLDLPEFGTEALPGEWDGWVLEDFQLQQRVVDDPMGEFSQVWTYRGDGVVAKLSLDYPYTRAHDLTSCYKGTGWSISSREILDDADSSSGEFAFARLDRRLFGTRLLYYSLHDTAGNCEVRFKEDLGVAELLHKRVDYTRPWFQIQVLAAGPASFTAQQEKHLRAFFFQMRETLLKRCVPNSDAGNY